MKILFSDQVLNSNNIICVYIKPFEGIIYINITFTKKLTNLPETFHENNCYILRKANKIIVFFIPIYTYTSGDTYIMQQMSITNF